MKILGMGWIELVIILAIVLIIFGPKQLPKLGRAIGKTVRSFKKSVGDDEAASDDPAGNQQADSEPVAKAASQLPAPAASSQAEPAPAAPAASAEAAPKVVKKTVVKKKVE